MGNYLFGDLREELREELNSQNTSKPKPKKSKGKKKKSSNNINHVKHTSHKTKKRHSNESVITDTHNSDSDDSEENIEIIDGNGRGKNNVMWGSVQILEFPREVGEITLPAKGDWPLGIVYDLEKSKELGVIPIDDYEVDRLEVLQGRIKKLPKKARIVAKLETRQFDYRDGLKNPIFGPLNEDLRRKILLHSNKDRSCNGSNNSSLQGSPVKLDAASSNASFVNDVESDFKDSIIRSKAKVIHQENEAIRESRQTDIGCNCSSVTNMEQMSNKRIKEELRKRGCINDNFVGKNKEMLIEMLQELLKDENLCETNRCQCFLLNVKCHSEVCDCCTSSLNGGKSCCNPEGLRKYENKPVTHYRQSIIAGLRDLDKSSCRRRTTTV